MFQIETVLHELVHVQDGVRAGIGDIQADFHLIHRRIEDADVERLLLAMRLPRKENPDHGAHEPQEIPLLFRPPRFPGIPAGKQHAERPAVASDGQHQRVEPCRRFPRKQCGKHLL